MDVKCEMGNQVACAFKWRKKMVHIKDIYDDFDILLNCQIEERKKKKKKNYATPDKFSYQLINFFFLFHGTLFAFQIEILITAIMIYLKRHYNFIKRFLKYILILKSSWPWRKCFLFFHQIYEWQIHFFFGNEMTKGNYETWANHR